MGQSKNMLMEMRAEDFALMYSHDFTKSKAIEAGNALVEKIFEDGELDEFKIYSNIVRLKTVIDTADKAFRERLKVDKSIDANGVNFTFKKGSEKLNYSEDLEVAELEEKLKARKELVKLATKSKETIYDANGVEVTKVSSSFEKSSITVKF